MIFWNYFLVLLRLLLSLTELLMRKIRRWRKTMSPRKKVSLNILIICFLSSYLTHFTVEYRAPKSLSAACHRFLGRPLLKTQQVSRWDSRPLTGEQRVYAALDAHCLIGLLDIAVQKWIEKSLSTKAEAIGVSFSEIEKGEPVSGMIDSTQCYALSVANLYITI